MTVSRTFDCMNSSSVSFVLVPLEGRDDTKSEGKREQKPLESDCGPSLVPSLCVSSYRGSYWSVWSCADGWALAWLSSWADLTPECLCLLLTAKTGRREAVSSRMSLPAFPPTAAGGMSRLFSCHAPSEVWTRDRCILKQGVPSLRLLPEHAQSLPTPGTQDSPA